jgi:cystathionine beta-lyase/cystathionine gamma-synthase
MMHSATKYLGGHSDVLSGVLVAPAEDHPLFAKARLVERSAGTSGLRSPHPHEIARRQMSAPLAMLSFQVRGGREAASGMSNPRKPITRATSLGGTESLIGHRHSVEGKDTRAPENLLRMSGGLEHADDLIADLDRALG